VDKQKLEEARQLAMSMTSHPVAFGTIEHTEKAGELLAELVKANAALAREAHTWSKAAETYAADAERLRAVLRKIEACEYIHLPTMVREALGPNV
jgi:L-asparaginase II